MAYRPNGLELRVQLFNNGFVPLPGTCYIDKKDGEPRRYPVGPDTTGNKKWVGLQQWSTQWVDEQWLTACGNIGTTTNLRLDGFLAIDLDVDDPILSDRIKAVMPKSPFVRTRGESPRCLRLFNYACEEPLKSLHWLVEGKSQGIDILYGAKRQFTAFGKHYTGSTYEWLDKDPTYYSAEHVPSISAAEIRDFLTLAQEILDKHAEEHGITYPSYEGGDYSDVQYVLKPTDVFVVREPGVYVGAMTVREMEVEVRKGHQLRCNLTAVRPESDSGAGLAKIGKGGDFIIVDFVREQIYAKEKTTELTPERLQNRRDIIKKLKEQGNAPEPLIVVKDSDEPVVNLTETIPLDNQPDKYIMVGGEMAVHVRNPQNRYQLSHFKNVIGKHAYDDWFSIAQRANMEVFRPDEKEGVVDIIDPNYNTVMRMLNTYRVPADYEGGNTSVFHQYLTHLVPNDVERELLLDWMAYKTREPWQRLHALYFFTRSTEGCGRGTLFNILRNLFGPYNCKQVPFKRIVSDDGQAEYNDHLLDALLVFSNEAPKPRNAREAHLKHEAFKAAVDPFGADEESITAKYKGLRFARIVASYIFATNNPDALPITDKDRRVACIETPNELPSNHPIHEWRQNLANITALRNELKERKCKVYDYTKKKPPMTVSKLVVVGANTSTFELAVRHLIDLRKQGIIKTDILSIGDIEGWIKGSLAESELYQYPLGEEEKFQRDVRGLLRRLNVARTKTLKVPGRGAGKSKAERLVVISSADKWADGTAASNAGILEEFNKGLYGEGRIYEGGIVRAHVVLGASTEDMMMEG